MRFGNRMKCKNRGCDQWLEARLVNSHRLGPVTWLFAKTAAVITCPTCDSSRDPESTKLWLELRNTAPPPHPGPNPHHNAD